MQARQKLGAYAALMRLDRPIGIYLVLWPTLWALWLAADGVPDWRNLAIFIAGAILMRSAGCIINDFADRNFDGYVERTKNRPLVLGLVSSKEALILFSLLCSVAFCLVLFTNKLTVLLSFAAVGLASLYPFVKRHSHLPQVVLGAAFAWSVPMAFAAQNNHLDARCWLLYTAVLLWTVAYDTFYAMVDRDDDIKIGVKSTAVLFGDADRMITAFLQFTVIFALALVGQRFELGGIYKLSVVITALLFLYQQWLIRAREPSLCFKAFLHNNFVGMTIFAGIVLDKAFI
ncbi:4-hydroxybenzoate octaprenyltransferase [Agaribacterium haliotis]|uniref:4-hydroxybenzoate octaprenyltransferase n=1 Tax=Agaribacterium haliotis TaxID=2013869 RepID=UPI000BB54C3E|nr:4-hydroxybenzoate octaprenyltransferase [Agaribacterium haliotis]